MSTVKLQSLIDVAGSCQFDQSCSENQVLILVSVKPNAAELKKKESNISSDKWFQQPKKIKYYYY